MASDWRDEAIGLMADFATFVLDLGRMAPNVGMDPATVAEAGVRLAGRLEHLAGAEAATWTSVDSAADAIGEAALAALEAAGRDG